MTNATIYAMRQLTLIGKEDGFEPHNDGNKIYLLFPSGRTLSLSDTEIKYQAEQFLLSEIESLKY
jgi:hypothetical protein